MRARRHIRRKIQANGLSGPVPLHNSTKHFSGSRGHFKDSHAILDPGCVKCTTVRFGMKEHRR
jgi:hypothetical protein